MHWKLVLFTALWWAFIGTILMAAMSLGVTLSVTRAGWVRRTWRSGCHTGSGENRLVNGCDRVESKQEHFLDEVEKLR